jgi:serine/threonine protein kinase
LNPASLPPPAPPTSYEIGPGHVLGRYELLMPIAAGGMAMVWAARLKGTRGFQKIVAVKTMLPKLSEDDQFEKMFLDEATLASKVRHPNAVEILDLGEQDGVLFLIMEWIDGIPLNQIMKVAKRNGGVPTTVATRIVMQACAGLHAAHELTDGKGRHMGLVHRDISPQNILVTFDGVAKVVDFGVAKATALGDSTTQAGQLKGKVGYMAPEQVRGEAIDRRSDVFAMGIVLYALTTGKHPFRRESEGATLFSITSPDPVLSPRRLLPNYPLPLEAVVLKALEKDRDKRYASASELLKALDKALPPNARGSDEQVGAFVQSLFDEQRRQTHAALTEALERADQHQLSTGGARYSSRPPQGGASGVSAFSTVGGISASLAPPKLPDDLELQFARSNRRFTRGALAVGLAVAVALGAVLIWLGSGDSTANVAAKPAAPAVTPAPAPSPPPPAPATASAAPSEAPEPSAAPPPVAVPAAPRALPRSAAASPITTTPVPASSAPPLKRSWKQDPGF